MLGKKKYYQFQTLGHVVCGNDEVTCHINFSTLLHGFEKQITEIFVCKFVCECVYVFFHKLGYKMNK
jgi:hypothetical protein